MGISWKELADMSEFWMAEFQEAHPECLKPQTDEDALLEVFMEYERTDDDLLH